MNRNRDLIEDAGGNSFKQKWNTLFYELRISKLRGQYYSFYLERRLLYALSLVLLRDYPFLQVSCNCLLSLQVLVMQQFLVVSLLKPFVVRLVQFCHFGAEILVFLVFGCTGVFLFDQNIMSSDFLTYTGILLTLAAIFLHLIISCILLVVSAYQVTKSKPRERQMKSLDMLQRKSHLVL